jgi:hypothetical protein
MLDTQQALGALARQPPSLRAATARRALVVGAGGALGAAVMAQLLATRDFERVGALVDQAITPALAGFVAVPALEVCAFGADTALVVFDCRRRCPRSPACCTRPAHAG